MEIPEQEDHKETGHSFTLRDVFIMIASVVSIVTAWGVYSTRLAVVEDKIVTITEQVKQINNRFDQTQTDIYNKLDTLDSKQRDLQITIHDINNNMLLKYSELKLLIDQQAVLSQQPKHHK